MKNIKEIAKSVLDKFIKVPIETISTKCETIYVSSAIQACVDSIIESQKWIPIEQLDNSINPNNILIKFDDGSVRRYMEDFPFAIATHFRLIELN